MPKRVATKSVAAEQVHVHGQDERSNTDAEVAVKPNCFPNVVSENDDKEQGNVHEITVNILHDQRERPLTEIRFARFAHGAGRWVGPESFVVGTSIIITSQPKAAGRPQNQKCRREVDPGGPPTGSAMNPRVRRIAEDFRRIERRDVIAKVVVRALKRGPRRVNDERRQSEKDKQWLGPPNVCPHRLTKRWPWQSLSGPAVH